MSPGSCLSAAALSDFKQPYLYYEFDISLCGSNPRLSRRFLLHRTASFADLHEAIQDACGWKDKHLYFFYSSARTHRAVLATGFASESDWKNAPPARMLSLASYFKKESSCLYAYDFGDNWELDIQCRPAETEGFFQRKLLKARGVFPPEDCGGLQGYNHLIDLFNGLEEDEEGLLHWIGDWHPNRFDLPGLQAQFNS